MKILVGYKRVVDYNVRIQVKPDGSGVVTDGVKLSANPFDEIALEEALRLRDKGIATEVVVATIGPADAQAHLRNGLAMGANRAIHVVTTDAIQPLTAARVLLKLIEKEQPQLVILGKQAIDDDANQTGQMLATLWGRPQATFAGKLDVVGDKATVVREVDAGLETLEVDLPAVVTTDLRLNEPRFIKLPDIMKAKSKPLETLPLADLGVESGDTLKTTHYAPPPKRSKGVMVKERGRTGRGTQGQGLAVTHDSFPRVRGKVGMGAIVANRLALAPTQSLPGAREENEPENRHVQVLIVAEHLDGKLNAATAKCVTAAKANEPGAASMSSCSPPIRPASPRRPRRSPACRACWRSRTPPTRTPSRRCWRRRSPSSPPATPTSSAPAPPSART
jgi:electron transfer flavoprotein beta subunit